MSEQEEIIQELFVQTAHGAEHADGRLVLRNVAPATLFFSDRPQRIVGHLSTEEFVETWGEGEDSFAEVPPNAVLSFVAKGETEPWNTVIEISDPQIAGSDLSYAAKVLEARSPPLLQDAHAVHRSNRTPPSLAGFPGRHEPPGPPTGPPPPLVNWDHWRAPH